MPTAIPKVVIAAGTRPEVIKLAPVVRALRATDAPLDVAVLATAQHREMLDQMLQHFDIEPAVDLDLMQPGQRLHQLTARIIEAATEALEALSPDILVVQGDTTTTFVCALAAFYLQIPVAHVEAGLRSNDMSSPFPEEGNRRLTSVITRLHFPPTQRSRQLLLNEGVPDSRISVVGNTVIDALLQELAIEREAPEVLDAPLAKGPMILVTLHRRENHGAPHQRIAEAIVALLDAHDDAWAVLPLHPNPQVATHLKALMDHPRCRVVDPLPYPDFVRALASSRLVISDSGGVQEEAPSLGVPVLVARDTTERPEGVDAGTSILVAADYDRIIATATPLLVEGARAHPKDNPFGDGHAADRIANTIVEFLGGDSSPDA